MRVRDLGSLVQINEKDLLRSADLDEKDDQVTVLEARGLSDEAEQLFVSLITRAYSLYLWETDFSVNFLLSADVRHGFLKNHLRRSLQASSVICSKSAPGGEYRDNDDWMGKLGSSLPAEVLDTLNKASKKFSGIIDDLIAELITRIVQIKISASERARMEEMGIGERLKGSDNGHFDYESYFQLVRSNKEELDTVDDIESFSDFCFSVLQDLTSESLVKMKGHFESEIVQIVNDACDELSETIRTSVENPRLKSDLLVSI